MSRASRTAGKAGEALTQAALIRHGFRCIERVHTPWRVIRSAVGGVSRITGATPEQKVSGDFRAVGPMGRSVLVEAKFDAKDRILFSDLADHQIRALNEHHEAGGLSILSVVLHGRAHLLEWPVPGFGPGTSIRILGGRLELSGNKKGGPGTRDRPTPDR